MDEATRERVDRALELLAKLLAQMEALIVTLDDLTRRIK